jgi:hypothetical protein
MGEARRDPGFASGVPAVSSGPTCSSRQRVGPSPGTRATENAEGGGDAGPVSEGPRASKAAAVSILCAVTFLVALGVALPIAWLIPWEGYGGVALLMRVGLVGLAVLPVGLVLGIWAIRSGDRRYGAIALALCAIGPGIGNGIMLVCLWGIGSS